MRMLKVARQFDCISRFYGQKAYPTCRKQVVLNQDRSNIVNHNENCPTKYKKCSKSLDGKECVHLIPDDCDECDIHILVERGGMFL